MTSNNTSVIGLRRTTRPFRHALTLSFITVFVRLVRIMPQRFANQIGRILGLVIGRFAWRARRLSEQNLRYATLEYTPSLDRCWADMGQRLVEFARMERMLERVHLDARTDQLLQEAMTHSVGTLVATAHFGNWELMAAALARRGFPVHAIASESKSLLHKWLDQERRRFGVRTFSRGGGAKATLAHLRKGKPVALFVDQVSAGRCRQGLFLGRQAYGSRTYDRIRQLSKAPGLLIWNVRDEDGQYHIKALRIPNHKPVGPWLDERIGMLVKQNPEQWIWLHNRWIDAE